MVRHYTGNKSVEQKIEDGISCVTWHEKCKCYTATPHLRIPTPPKKLLPVLTVNLCLSDILRHDRYNCDDAFTVFLATEIVSMNYRVCR